MTCDHFVRRAKLNSQTRNLSSVRFRCLIYPSPDIFAYKALFQFADAAAVYLAFTSTAALAALKIIPGPRIASNSADPRRNDEWIEFALLNADWSSGSQKHTDLRISRGSKSHPYSEADGRFFREIFPRGTSLEMHRRIETWEKNWRTI